MRIVEFYGAKGGQGTTTTACLYALSQAQAGQRVHLLASDITDTEIATVCGEGYLSAEGWATLTSNVTWGVKIPSDTDLVIADHHITYDNEHWDRRNIERILVIRNCFLALKASFDDRPDAAVAILEPGRALGLADMERVIACHLHQLPFDPSIARAVDAGLLVSRPPRVAMRALALLPVNP